MAFYESRASGKASASGAGSAESRISQGIQLVEQGWRPPALTGTEGLTQSQIAEATKNRKELGKFLQRYAVTETNNGEKVGDSIAASFTQGSREEISAAVLNHAKSLTFGNDSLLDSKLAQSLALQNELAGRKARYRKLFSEKTSAKFWIDNGDGYGQTRMKAYIDGLTGMDNIKPTGTLVTKKRR